MFKIKTRCCAKLNLDFSKFSCKSTLSSQSSTRPKIISVARRINAAIDTGFTNNWFIIAIFSELFVRKINQHIFQFRKRLCKKVYKFMKTINVHCPLKTVHRFASSTSLVLRSSLDRLCQKHLDHLHASH